jgi:polyisoprenyl-teichoic acid--peptidoglycan teichoic acid transferase
MQRRQRRMNQRQRNPRAARNPAYQIKPRYHLAADSTAEGNTESWDVEPASAEEDAEWRKPEPVAESSDPEETSFQPEVSQEDEPPSGATAEVPVVDTDPPAANDNPESVTESDVDTTASSEAPVEDFSTYVRKIEEAAARSRAERRGAALAGHRPVVSAGHHPAAGAVPAAGPSARRRPPAEPIVSGRHHVRSRRGGPPPPPVKQSIFRRRRSFFIILAILILIPVVIVSLYAANILRLGISAYGEIHTEPEDRVRYRINPEGTPEAIPEQEAEQVLPDWGANDIVNIVLMGIDDRDDDAVSVRSDTIIIVHIDPQTRDVAMMSIPRDLRVYIPPFGHDKMNAAYAIGDANDDTIPGGGPTLVAQTIEANFNIPIHYYATIDFQGFETIVDSVGGIIIDVPNQLSDNLYPTEDLRLTRIYFSSGLQTMDGKTALEYVRTRHADSDIARGQRQQQVLMAIRERAVVRDLITRAPELIEGVSGMLRTDLDFNQMLALANLGRQIDADNITRIDLWQEGLLTEHFPDFEGDAYYLEANWIRILNLQEQYFKVPEPAPTPTLEPVAAAEPTATTPAPTPTIEATEPDLDTPVMVENGTETPALAGHTAQFLFDSGFTAVWASDAEEPAEETIIYDSSSNPLTARHLADLLDLSYATIVQVEGNGDIVVVIGDDFPVQTEVNVGP